MRDFKRITVPFC